VKDACDAFSSNLEADDLVAWPEINAETLAHRSFCKMGRQLMNFEPVTKEVPQEATVMIPV
jgi:hypothetical protein